jgi:erythronate-4-phosphate dehydrogenase
MKIVADHKIPFLKGAFDSTTDIAYLPGKDISRSDLADADALIVRTRTICNNELLSGSKVKCIATATIGYDHIDTNYCEKHNIYWTNAPGCNANSVKQYVASALACIIQQEKKSFSNITLGIIGAGHVGSRVATLAKSLGINTLVNDPPRERKEGAKGFVDLHTLITQSDIVTLHVPLKMEGTDKTFHLANEKFFLKMKPDSWFINTSRGEVADTRSLVNALKNKHLAGSVIDVWENEPDISRELLIHATLTTPHIAGYSLDGKANGTTMSVRAISRFFKLGMDSWKPDFIPGPEQPDIYLTLEGKTAEQVFYQLAIHAYNINQDSEQLKSSPQTFEKQREDYPARREPPAFTIHFDQADETSEILAKAMGFKISNKQINKSTNQQINKSTNKQINNSI